LLFWQRSLLIAKMTILFGNLIGDATVASHCQLWV
jgi:hypothetical protein